MSLALRATLTLAALGAALSLGACGRLNRTATEGSAATRPTVAGLALESALQRELANRGAPAGSVTCAHNVLVHVGITSACAYVRDGHTEVVTFKFADQSGRVAAGSVVTR